VHYDFHPLAHTNRINLLEPAETSVWDKGCEFSKPRCQHIDLPSVPSRIMRDGGLAFAAAIVAALPAFTAGEDVKESAPTRLSIAAAADLKFALDDLIKEFEGKYPATKVNVTCGLQRRVIAVWLPR
jgi:hypothetical protein